MTYRSRTVAKRPRRSSWDAGSRRNLYLNLGFGAVIFVSLAILVSLAASSWYGDHWAAAASVDGTNISKDDVRARVAVDQFKISQEQQQLAKLRNAGQITSDEYTTAVSNLSSQASVATTALQNIEQDLIVQKLAAQRGISVTDQQVEAQIQKDGTIQPQRHVLVIGVEPQPADGQTVPTAADVTTAQQQAQTYHDQIVKDGKKWDDVAKTANAGVISGTGDLGLLNADATTDANGTQIDPSLLQAAFQLQKNGVTDVFKSDDGVFRFATVTEIAPAQSNPDYEKAIGDAGVNMDAYRSMARGEALLAALKASVNQEFAGKPVEQRHVQEVFIQGADPSTGPQVRSRLLVFAPNHNTSGAAQVAATDPAWTDAQKRAQDAYDQLTSGKATFADLAASQSDVKPGPRSLGPGGDLGFADNNSISSTLQLPELATALFAPNLKTDEILKPVKTSLGYIVAQYVASRPSPSDRIAAVQLQLAAGKDLGQLAQTYSDASDAANGGDLGWIARYQVDPSLEDAVFKLKVGEVSQPITTSNGTYIVKLLGTETKAPDGHQAALLKTQIWDAWYNNAKAKVNIWTDPAGVDSLVATPSPS